MIEVYYTPTAYKKMFDGGLIPAIKNGYFRLGDENKIYGVTDTIKMPNYSGDKLNTTLTKCNLANRSGITKLTPTTEQIKIESSRVKMGFLSTDCNGGFDVQDLNVIFNIHSYLNSLTAIITGNTYTPNLTGLEQVIYDEIYGDVEYRNIESTWESQYMEKRLDLTYIPLDDKSLNNYSKISSTHVKVDPLTGVKSVNFSSEKYKSPFLVYFGNNQINGSIVQGGSLVTTLNPDYYGYYTKNKNNEVVYYTTTSELETYVKTNGIESFKEIYPCAFLNNGRYKYILQTTTNYNTTNDPLLGYSIFGFKNVDGSGDSLLQGMINQSKLFMKTTGVLNSKTGNYEMKLSFKVYPRAYKNFNDVYDNKHIGGNLTMTFVYDESSTSTTNIVEILS